MNVNNARNKHCTLLSLVEENDFDILCLSETHYNINSDILLIPGFVGFHAQKLTGGRGVSIWVKENL